MDYAVYQQYTETYTAKDYRQRVIRFAKTLFVHFKPINACFAFIVWTFGAVIGTFITVSIAFDIKLSEALVAARAPSAQGAVGYASSAGRTHIICWKVEAEFADQAGRLRIAVEAIA